jgi:putative glutamine amidotransferase
MVNGGRVAVARWESVPGEQIESYWQRLRDAGVEPQDFCEPGRCLDGVSGLVLTGGIDIDPARYSEAPVTQVTQTDPQRDDFEVSLLEEALARDLPVLAICRGHQLLNVCFGGKLLQHIESGEHVAQADEGRTSRAHAVTLAQESRLAKWTGEKQVLVNSRHHQAVTAERLAPGLQATAVSEDGLIEGVESERHTWVVGVQWHPERVEPQIPGFEDASLRLFAAFAQAVRQD